MPEIRFADLGLPVALVQALRREGREHAFPVQCAVIPDILAGHDVIARAATGSGKTLAFGLPLLARLTRGASAPRHPRAVILAPTRELAAQIARELDEPALSLGLRIATAVGGVPIARQIARLERGADVLVGTPGRLIDLLARDGVALDAVTVIAIDEADHMAELGFLEQVTEILDAIAKTAQHLLFSATLDGAIEVALRHRLRDPVRHNINGSPSADVDSPAGQPISADTVSRHLLLVRTADKYTVVTEIAARSGRTLLFVRNRFAADKVATQLRAAGIAATALHGGRSQQQRNRALAAFAAGAAPVLVATDVAARGIHVDDISLVVHVDPPADAKDHLHRTGRTARAGATGTVVTLATDDDRAATESMLAATGRPLEAVRVRPGDARLTDLTGARHPPGRPVPDPAAPPPDAPPARDTTGPRRRNSRGEPAARYRGKRTAN